MTNKASTITPRPLIIGSVALFAAFMAVLGISSAHGRGLPTGGPPPITVAGMGHPSFHPTATAVINVERFGADPTGQRDSTAAIQAAIAAAERHPGSEVYFPPGRFILDQPSRNLFTFVIDAPITITGAGIHRTTLVNEVGAKNPRAPLSRVMFAIEVAPGQQTGGGSGTVIENMTLNSATYDAGTDIMDFANHTTLKNLEILAAKSTNTYNPNAFGIRVLAICNPRTLSHIYRVDNVVQHVTLIGQGSDGNTELDLSCQVGSTASDIQIEGNGVDIYYSRDDTLRDATLVGGTTGSTHDFTWVITGSSHIDLSHITTNGNGGVIEPDVVLVSHHITISQETMRDKHADLFIGDSRDVTISDSHLGGIAIVPREAVVGVHVEHTSYGAVRCRSSATIEGLTGLACS